MLAFGSPYKRGNHMWTAAVAKQGYGRRFGLYAFCLLLSWLIGCGPATPPMLKAPPAAEDAATAQPAAAARPATPAAEPTGGKPLFADDRPLKEALELARADNKVVVVFAYAPEDALSQMMQELLQRDARAVELLNSRTVPIKVNVRTHWLMGMQYKLEHVPTFLFLRADGTEIARLGAAMELEDFLWWARQHVDGLDDFGIELRNVIEARQRFAGALISAGKKQQALDELLWCLDACTQRPKHLAAQADDVTLRLYWLGEEFGKAREALRACQARARARLAETPCDPLAARLAVHVAQYYEDEEGAIELLLKELMSACDDPELLAWLAREGLPLLAHEGRYEEIARLVDVEAAALACLEKARAEFPDRADYPRDWQWQAARRQHLDALAGEIYPYYQVLVAQQQDEAAARVAAGLLELRPGPDTLNTLAWAGFETGRPSEENVRQAEEACRTTRHNSAAYIDTLARVLAARGQHEEALEILAEDIARMKQSDDRELLEACRRQISQAAETQPGEAP